MADSAKIVILTGLSGSGKTQTCLALQELAVQLGWQTAGLVSPGVYEGSRRTAIALRDIASGEERLLAALKMPAEEAETGLVVTGRWVFNAETLAWGNRILHDIDTCQLLLVDELGPLEWERQQGLTAAFAAIEQPGVERVLVVVRPVLLGAARLRWPNAQVFEKTGQTNVEVAAREVLNLLQEI